MKKLCKFYWNCGRIGYLEGLFIADPDDIPFTEDIYFGEVLGKHSDIHGRLDKEDIEYIDIPDEVVLLLEEKIGRTISGYNPIDYWENVNG